MRKKLSFKTNLMPKWCDKLPSSKLKSIYHEEDKKRNENQTSAFKRSKCSQRACMQFITFNRTDNFIDIFKFNYFPFADADLSFFIHFVLVFRIFIRKKWMKNWKSRNGLGWDGMRKCWKKRKKYLICNRFDIVSWYFFSFWLFIQVFYFFFPLSLLLLHISVQSFLPLLRFHNFLLFFPFHFGKCI